jgi:serine-type D-Ala-D-Ala carboxypeptidase (penicillin-binding protein 5/6)
VRRAARLVLAVGIVVVCIVGAVALTTVNKPSPPAPSQANAAPTVAPGSDALDLGTAPTPLAVRLGDPEDAVKVDFKHPPRAGLLFDVGTGRVLWRRNATKRLPIASLTKMMTALVVTDRLPQGAHVLITSKALHYRGSGVGVLPHGKRIGVSAMLHGLLLPSGNDAARALAIRIGGTIGAFVGLMNERAAAMGLSCTHYTSPDGYVDRGNRSCAADLAAIGRAVLREPRLAPIVARPQAVLPFPIKGGKLYLTNNNPLLRRRYQGVTGIKTGYTDAAGLCIVATARRGPIHLGVVLLHTPNWDVQARQLLDRGFNAELSGAHLR